MVVATNPRVTGGIEVRYWSGVDRMAIPKLTGHGDDFAARLTDLFVRVVLAALKGCVTSADPLSPPLRHDHPMADYGFRPGGSLKLKGGVAEGGIVKKYVSLVRPIYRQCLRSSGRRNQSRSRSLTT